jgi:hypothetical protein
VSCIRYLVTRARLRTWLNPASGLRLITGLAVALTVLAILLLAGGIR